MTKKQEALVDSDFVKPFIVRNSSAYSQWQAEDTVRSYLIGFPPTFKKDKNYVDVTIGIHTSPMLKGTPGVETEAMFAAILRNSKALPMQDVAENWGCTSWSFAVQVGKASISTAPSMAGCARALQMGEVECWSFDIGAASFKGNSESMEHIKSEVSNYAEEALAGLNTPIHYVHLRAGDIYYTPPGYMLIEKVVKGPLCFGIRKSLFIKSESSKVAYEKCKSLLEKDGKDVAQMCHVLAKLT